MEEQTEQLPKVGEKNEEAVNQAVENPAEFIRKLLSRNQLSHFWAKTTMQAVVKCGHMVAKLYERLDADAADPEKEVSPESAAYAKEVLDEAVKEIAELAKDLEGKAQLLEKQLEAVQQMQTIVDKLGDLPGARPMPDAPPGMQDPVSAVVQLTEVAQRAAKALENLPIAKVEEAMTKLQDMAPDTKPS
jgi:hypothetical protein